MKDNWRCLFHSTWHDNTVDPRVCHIERGKAILAGEYTCQGECISVKGYAQLDDRVWVVACKSCGGSYCEYKDIW